jgi:hypothetical protein
MCDALGGCLMEAEEVKLPSLEAKIRDVRRLCLNAKDILTKIKVRTERLSRKK